jgi:hypothetical protein
MGAYLEVETGSVNVSWNFIATAGSGIYDSPAGLPVHLLRRTRFACISELGSQSQWMDLAANLSLRLKTNTESSTRDTRWIREEAISDSCTAASRMQ